MRLGFSRTGPPVSCSWRSMSFQRHASPVSRLAAANPSPTQTDGSALGMEENGQARAEAARPLPEVKEPTPEEVAKHCLTHLPYRRWCRWCVAARMLATAHWVRPAFSRSTPLLALAYCFIKHARDERCLTVLVGRLYPAIAGFAVPCSEKEADVHATRRLSAFIRACGVSQFARMGGQ